MLAARFFLALVAWCCAPLVSAQETFSGAANAGAELSDICRRDHGALWGASLCGPLLVVDPASRATWGSDPDATGALTEGFGGWTGVLPAGVPIANTSVDWAGERWIMLVAPLPADRTELRVLVAHEAWHRVQTALRLPQAPSDCSHLESEEGRTLLRLEMRALATALRSRGAARAAAARDALGFRAARLQRFSGADSHETSLDRNEGLASYTGVRLGAGETAETFAARTLDAYDRHEAYARAYAYATGPAYGLLLDENREGWRREMTLDSYSPASLLAAALRAEPLSPSRLRQAVERYGGLDIRRQETARAAARSARVAELRARFGGARLELPILQSQMEFDPSRVTPVEGLGNVYAVITLRDVWGEVRAVDGALVDSAFSRLTVATPNAGGVTGPGWSLQLSPGYEIGPPDEHGVLRVQAAPPPPPPSSLPADAG